MKESFLQTFTRTALKTDFKISDNVPILQTPGINLFGSTVGEINKMSKAARMFEYGWYAFALVVTFLVLVIGVVLLLPNDTKSEITPVAAIFFALIWLFSLIQFLSLVGYIRYRMKK